jgi:hypothetical protein
MITLGTDAELLDSLVLAVGLWWHLRSGVPNVIRHQVELWFAHEVADVKPNDVQPPDPRVVQSP